MDGGNHKPQNFHRNEDDRKIIVHPLYLPKQSPWLDLKVFYVRLSNYEVDESTPEHLTIKHTSLTSDTVLEVNGTRSGMYSDSVSCLLRRDRMDKKTEEVTFVSTDYVMMIGSIRFDVWDGDDMLLGGVLELRKCNGYDDEAKKHNTKWSMRCQSVPTASFRFLANKIKSAEVPVPIIEVYVTAFSSGTPIILTKTIQLSYQRKPCLNLLQDSIMDNDSSKNEFPFPDSQSQTSGYKDDRLDNEADRDYDNLHSNLDYTTEDGDVSWFKEGVKVGVGISVGVCLSIGIGVGLLLRTYQATRQKFKRPFF